MGLKHGDQEQLNKNSEENKYEGNIASCAG